MKRRDMALDGKRAVRYKTSGRWVIVELVELIQRREGEKRRVSSVEGIHINMRTGTCCIAW
jgi:hypothetical protein